MDRWRLKVTCCNCPKIIYSQGQSKSIAREKIKANEGWHLTQGTGVATCAKCSKIPGVGLPSCGTSEEWTEAFSVTKPSTEKTMDYSAVMSDLNDKRLLIDAAIKALEKVMQNY